jgi:hypothetical protein
MLLPVLYLFFVFFYKTRTNGVNGVSDDDDVPLLFPRVHERQSQGVQEGETVCFETVECRV